MIWSNNGNPIQTIGEDQKTVYMATNWQWASLEHQSLKTLPKKLNELEVQGWEIFNIQILGKASAIMTATSVGDSGDQIVFMVLVRRPAFIPAGQIMPGGEFAPFNNTQEQQSPQTNQDPQRSGISLVRSETESEE